MANMKIRTNLKVAVFVAGPREVDRDAQLCQALLIERELAKVAHVTILDSAMMPTLNPSEALDFLEESFDVILVLTSDRTAGPHQLHTNSKNTHSTPSLCRWNVSGIDVWVEASKYDQAVYAALKGVDYEGFGRMDLLGPLKSANRLDIQETAVPSIYP